MRIAKKLTSSEGEDAKSRRAKQPRVHTIKLPMEHPIELLILRRVLAERRRGRDTIDIQRVPRVLRVLDRVVNQRRLVHDALRLSEVDHGVRVHLLRARVCVREERVDAVLACERDTGVAGREVAAADEAEVLPALSDGGEVRLGDALGDGGSGEPLAGFGALGLGFASWGSCLTSVELCVR